MAIIFIILGLAALGLVLICIEAIFKYWYISLLVLVLIVVGFYFFTKTDKYKTWMKNYEIKKRTDKIFDIYRSTRHVIDEDREFFEENTGTTLEDHLEKVEILEKEETERKEQQKQKQLQRETERTQKQKELQEKNTQDPFWKYAPSRISPDLSLDEVRNTWQIKNKTHLCSDLLSYDLKENDSSIIGGGFSTGGFVGGNVGNDVAGMTGGYSGSRKVKHTVSRIELFINVRNSRKNTEIITIYKGKPLDVTSHVYRSYYKQAQSDISILDDIASRSKQ